MADQLKEIYAGTLTVADIATTGAATLATTNANTQYAIKDVSVSGTFGAGSPTLTVNGFSVADLSSNATGTEIVDVSSTIKYQAFSSAPTLTATTQKLISYVGTAPSYTDKLSYNLNGVASSSTGGTTAITNALDNYTSTHNYAIATDGSLFYVYWDGNSSASLYKRAGSSNGSQTTVKTVSYGWFVFNGTDTYYYADYNASTSTLYKYNINTGVTTSTSVGAALAGTSYPSACLMNDGYILVNYSGNGQTSALTIVNPTTGAYTTISGLSDVSVSGTNYQIRGYYDSTTNRYTLYKRFNGTLYKHALNGAVTVGSGYSGGVTNSSYSISTSVGGATSGFNTGYVSVDSTNYTMAIHGVADKTELATFNTASSTLTTGIAWLPYRTNSDSIIQNTTVSTSASNFTATVKIRVTGVKSTI